MENVVVALFNFQKHSVMESLPEYVSSAVGKYATRCMAENEGVLVLPDEVADLGEIQAIFTINSQNSISIIHWPCSHVISAVCSPSVSVRKST